MAVHHGHYDHHHTADEQHRTIVHYGNFTIVAQTQQYEQYGAQWWALPLVILMA